MRGKAYGIARKGNLNREFFRQSNKSSCCVAVAQKYRSTPSRMEAVFALSALMEIPEQFKVRPYSLLLS